MMQKQMSYKKIIILVGAVIAVIAAVMIVLLVNKEEAFRSILVYEVEGDVSIERNGIGSMNASENLYLESGDRVSVAADSSMRMKLDDDKYVMAEADTIFSVEAQGTGENSKTKICLEQGAITNEIQHPLSEGSQYETSTPNSVMAVRGTIYRVELYTDENGEQNTKLCCFQGKVGATPILPDGTYGQEVLVPEGSELTVYNDGTVDGPGDITYGELPVQALQNLKNMLEDGQSVTGITLEALEELTEQAADSSEAAGESASEQSALSDVEEDSEQNDADTEISEQISAQAKGMGDSAQRGEGVKNPSQASKEVKGIVAPKSVTELSEQKQQTAGNSNTPPRAAAPAGNVGVGGDTAGDDNSINEDSGNSGNNSSSDDHKSDKKKHDKDKPNNDKPNDSKPGDSETDNNKPDNDKPVIPPKPEIYTVTFRYQGAVFATQKVKSGEMVSEPLLIPEAEGAWDFDFGTGIEADTTIEWKDNK